MQMDAVVALAHEAGRAIMAIYEAGADAAGVRTKDDQSPLTLADEASHAVIVAGLAKLTPDIPVISEEDSHPSAVAANALRWVVDPLDGTKEFVKRTNEFTVNIALVRGTTPIAGVVHAPALGVTWVGDESGATRHEAGARAVMRVTAQPSLTALRIVASKDHAGPAVRAMLDRMPEAQTLSMGSSIKFCLVAEGRADLYLRDGPTMEWDTAAAHAVLRAAGGDVLTLDGQSLTYGKPDLRNPHFMAVGDLSVDWPSVVSSPDGRLL